MQGKNIYHLSRDWILHRWTPFVKYFPESHTGVLIKLKIDGMIEQLGLATPSLLTAALLHPSETPAMLNEAPPPKKYVVNDNAPNAVLAIKLSPNLIQV